MKRFIAIISVLSILACMMVPVSAAGWYNDFSLPVLNVLDYATPNGLDGYSLSVNNGGSVTFDLGDYYYGSYVDIVFTMNGSAIKSATLNGESLTLINYGDNIRRLIGTIPNTRYKELTLTFSSYGTFRPTFLKFDLLPLTQSPDHLIGTLNWEYNGSTSGTVTMSSPQTIIGQDFSAISSPNSGKDFVDSKFRLICNDWYKYDYLTFQVYTNFNISSIYTSSDSGSLPFTTSYFQLGSDTGDYIDKLIEITVDLSGISKSSESIPFIELRCDQDKTKAASFQIWDVYGHIDIQFPDPELTLIRKFMNNVGSWFTTTNASIDTFMTNVGTWFDELAASITGVFEYDTTESEEDKEALEDQSSEIDQINDQMDEVTKPVIDDIDPDLGDDVGGNDILAGAAPFDSIFDSSIFLPMITISLTLAMASYVLFGKR